MAGTARPIEHPARWRDQTPVASGSSWWRLPFTAETWKRTLYALVAPVVGVAGALAGLLGAAAAAGRFQRELARRLLGTVVGEPRRAGKGVVAYGLGGLPLHLATFAVTAYGWSIVPMNTVLYPLRAGPTEDAWGGPTLAGAWTFHAVVGGLGFLLLMPWVVRGLTGLQARLARRLLT